MDTKANDAARKLIHDHEYPVAHQKNGFTPKQVYAPEAVLGMSREAQPRRPTVTWYWSIMCGEDTPNHIFIEVDSKCLIDLLRDPWTTKPWVESF